MAPAIIGDRKRYAAISCSHFGNRSSPKGDGFRKPGKRNSIGGGRSRRGKNGMVRFQMQVNTCRRWLESLCRRKCSEIHLDARLTPVSHPLSTLLQLLHNHSEDRSNEMLELKRTDRMHF